MTSDFERISQKIVDAVGELNPDLTHTRSQQLILKLQTTRLGPDVEKAVVRVLQALRRKRFFTPMGQISKVFLDRISDESSMVQLQLIQALIDQGILLEAKDELEDLVQARPLDPWVGSEARGLIGRVHKQVYVNARQRAGAAKRSLGRAIGAYYEVYLANKSEYWWHGINAVACLARAERDGIDASGFFQVVESVPDWKQMAEEILNKVSGYPEDHDDYTWAMATATEACVALELAKQADDMC